MKGRNLSLLALQLAVVTVIFVAWRGSGRLFAQISNPCGDVSPGTSCTNVLTWSDTPPASGQAPGEKFTDLPLGLYGYSAADLYLPGPLMPINVIRVYRSQDLSTNGSLFIGAFGVGTELNYNLWLYSPSEVAGQGYTSVDVILPNGGRVPFNRTSSCTQSGCADYTDAVFECSTVPDEAFLGATITYDTNTPGWDLRFRDGSVFGFGLGAPLQFIKDRNGNSLIFTWSNNQSGQLTKITSTDGRYVDLAYSGNLVASITDNASRTVSYSYTGNQLTGFSDALGHPTTFGWISPSSGNISKITDALNDVTNISYDSSNRLSKLSETASGQTSNTIYSQAYSTNSSGQPVVTITDANSFQGAFTFDLYNPSLGDGDSDGYLISLTQAKGKGYANTSQYTRAAGNDLITDYIEAVGNTLHRDTHYVYDPSGNGNLLSATAAYGTSSAVTTSYAYEPIFSQVTSSTDPDGNVTTLGYDSLGNLTSVTDPMGNRRTAARSSMGEIVVTTDPMSNQEDFNYDSAGDVTAVYDPVTFNATGFGYDTIGRVTSVFDLYGNTTNIVYDNDDNVTSVTDPLGHTTSYQYDALGRLKQLTDADNNISTTNYSGIFGTATACDALNNCSSSAYNALGQLTSAEDAGGVTVDLAYDGLGRATSISSSNSSTISYGYDALRRLTSANGNPLGKIVPTWDSLDRLLSEEQYDGTFFKGKVSYTYDNNGNRLSMTAGDQPVVNYTYNADSQVKSLSNGTLTASFSYDVDSRRYQAQLPNGVNAAYGYDQDSLLTSIGYSANGSSLGNLTYTYDYDGRRSSFGGSLAAVAVPTAMTATYKDNEIATFNSIGTGPMLAYDKDGHMTQDPSSGDTYTWKDGAFIKAQGSGSNSVDLAYDSLGRRGREGLNTSKTPPGFRDPATFCSNSSGACPNGIKPQYDTDYLYDGMTPVQQQNYTTCFNAPNSSSCYVTSKDYEENMLKLPDSGEVLARTDRQGTTFVPLLDGLGSPVGLVDSTGKIATGYQYDSFGAPTQSGSSNTYPYLFGGQEWSDPLNLMQLYHNSARDYSPGLHRFISRDPLGAGANLYDYVGDDPVNATDPTGLFPIGINLGSGFNSESGGSFGGFGCPEFICITGNFSTADYDPPENKPKPIFQPSPGCLGFVTALNKPYTVSTPCKYTSDQVMAAVESNFAGFADYKGSIYGVGVSSTFSPPSTGLQKGAVMPVSAAAQAAFFNQASAVTVESADTQSMTFTTHKGHPIYPGQITFAASQSGPGVVTFDIAATGTIAKPIPYYLGGRKLENAIWNNFLANVVALCTGGS
jgi:RHS repeat-associated protein